MTIYEADYDDASAVTNLTVEAVAPRGDSRAGRRAGLEKRLSERPWLHWVTARLPGGGGGAVAAQAR